MRWNPLRRATAATSIPLTDQWRTDLDSEVTAYRSGDVVTVVAWRLAVLADVTGEVLAYEIPPGFRPVPRLTDTTRDSRGADVYLSQGSNVRVTDPRGSVSHHSFTFITTDPMPQGGA